MLDNQTRMRSMLDLIESVDQGKKINLNESIEEKVSEDVEDTHQDPESLAEEALDAAAAYIQDKLGITDGGPAGMFFSGENGIAVEKIFADYIMFEYENMEDEDSDEEESNNSYYDSDREGDSNTRSNQFESTKSKTGKLPSMAHIKKMCKDGKTVAEICKMHPDCDRAELKKMVADCKDKLSESGEGNSSSREKSVSDSDEGYDKWDPKHPNFAKNYKKYKTSNPEGTLKSFIAHLKKGALAEGVRLNKFRQVADILKTLPENNRKILAKRHCKIFENHNPRFNSKKFMNYIGLNEDGYGNGEIEVNFINSGHGTTLGMKKVQAGSITLDNYGRPVMKVSSPFDAGNTLMANFDSKTGGWVVDLD